MQRRVVLWAVGVAVVAGLVVLGSRKEVQDFAGEVMDKAAESLRDLIALFEGFSSVVYKDDAGLWTIGYGHLIVRGDGFWHPDFNPNGRRTITRDEASALLDRDMAEARRLVAQYVKVPLTSGQFDGTVSLMFNVGPGVPGQRDGIVWLRSGAPSSFLRLLNQGDYAGAAERFKDWNKVTDPVTGQLVVSAGLTARRDKERETFLS